eukprot:3914076-Rhodomonas_salina.6
MVKLQRTPGLRREGASPGPQSGYCSEREDTVRVRLRLPLSDQTPSACARPQLEMNNWSQRLTLCRRKVQSGKSTGRG